MSLHSKLVPSVVAKPLKFPSLTCVNWLGTLTIAVEVLVVLSDVAADGEAPEQQASLVLG